MHLVLQAASKSTAPNTAFMSSRVDTMELWQEESRLFSMYSIFSCRVQLDDTLFRTPARDIKIAIL
jgi:hypothetical protein